ncbi:MAG: hypothetical protein AAF567_13325 [Actinomycetota bacterium]
MFWLFAMSTTVGLVLGIPQLVRRWLNPAGAATEHLTAIAAAVLTVAGLSGLLALAFDPEPIVAVIVAICLGLAAGAMVPEGAHWIAATASASSEPRGEDESPRSSGTTP